jgi:hypothetical protein
MDEKVPSSEEVHGRLDAALKADALCRVDDGRFVAVGHELLTTCPIRCWTRETKREKSPRDQCGFKETSGSISLQKIDNLGQWI